MNPKQLAQLAYLLLGAGLISGITYPIGALISRMQRAKSAGTWLESHFRWQIRTFWISLAAGAGGGHTGYRV